VIFAKMAVIALTLIRRFSLFVILALSRGFQQGIRDILIQNDVEGALSCTVCDMYRHTTPTRQACSDVKYSEELTVKGADISPQGYHIACLVGLPRADDGQRIAMEGVLITEGRELKETYRVSKLITGTVKTISMAGEGADENTLLRHLHPKVVDDL
jgi:hypothetical protein